jgi:hypothetical protein
MPGSRSSILVLVIVLTAALTIAMMASAAAGAVPWADNFDLYATGANMHAVGGWKGWSNDPTFTAFTTNFQARSAPNSLDIVSNGDMIHVGLHCLAVHPW